MKPVQGGTEQAQVATDEGPALATNAAVFLSALEDRGVDYLFVNAGTDWAPIVEALTIAREQGRAVPDLIAVPHENTAMAVAHGYYLATGRPQAVGVHNNVGTANAICGLMNAARDNVPILLIAGRTPYTESGSIASREVVVHWAQENFDQAGMVREQVKWDYELKSGQDTTEVIDRALDIAMTAPRGPVYLTLPREVLVETPRVKNIVQRRRSFGAVDAQPDRDAIRQLASWILAADMPMIITSVAGRQPQNVDALAEMAARFAIPVIQYFPRCLNLPSDHPMHMGYQPNDLLASSDLVIVIDCEVPWIRRDIDIGLGTRVVHLGFDPIYSTYPLRCFEDDLAITGASSSALSMLQESLDEMLTSSCEADIAVRKSRVLTAHEKLKIQSDNARTNANQEVPISPVWIASVLDSFIDENTIVVNETGLCLEQLNLRAPGSLFIAPSVGGLGWSLGAALGVKMGAPDKTVVVLLGDGSYMFGNPTPCHFLSAAQDLPILIIVANNAGWKAVDRAVRAVYPDGRAVNSGETMPLVDLKPSPAFEKIIEASGGYGERVETPSALSKALERALHAVRVEKRQALLNVISQ